MTLFYDTYYENYQFKSNNLNTKRDGLPSRAPNKNNIKVQNKYKVNNGISFWSFKPTFPLKKTRKSRSTLSELCTN